MTTMGANEVKDGEGNTLLLGNLFDLKENSLFITG
jgi:hypothetical protein